MMVRAEVWWDLVTAVGRLRYVQRALPDVPSADQMSAAADAALVVDELLDAILADTYLEVLYPDIIQPVDPRTN